MRILNIALLLAVLYGISLSARVLNDIDWRRRYIDGVPRTNEPTTYVGVPGEQPSGTNTHVSNY